MEHIEELISSLSSNDSTTRKYAVEDLGDIGDPRAVEPLVDLITENEEIAILESIAQSLIKIGGQSTVRTIIPLLRSDSALVRNKATDVLMNLGYDAVNELKQLAHDNDHDVRKFAVDILGLIGSDDSVAVLVDVLSDPHINVVCGAAEALGNIRSVEAAPYLEQALRTAQDPWLRFMLIESLGKIKSEQSIDLLHELLTEEDSFITSSVIRAIGNISDVSSIEHLMNKLQKGDSCSRLSCLEALDQIHSTRHDEFLKFIEDKNFLQILTPLTADKNLSTRRLVARLLGHVPCNNTVRVLLNMIDDDDTVWSAVHESLVDLSQSAVPSIEQNIKTESSVDRLIKLLRVAGDLRNPSLVHVIGDLHNHPSAFIRKEVAAALGKCHSPETLPYLLKMADNTDSEVKLAVVNALSGAKDSKAEQLLITMLQTPSREIREAAKDALAVNTLSDEATAQLINLLDSHDTEIVVMASEILSKTASGRMLPKIILHHNNTIWQVRRMIVDVIAKEKSNEYSDYLIPLLNDEERYVRIAAISALGDMPDINSKTIYLFNLLDDQDERIRYEAVITLKKLSPELAGKHLVEILDDNSQMIQMAAIEAIAHLKYTEATSILKDMLDTASDEVYCCIREALDAFDGNDEIAPYSGEDHGYND